MCVCLSFCVFCYGFRCGPIKQDYGQDKKIRVQRLRECFLNPGQGMITGDRGGLEGCGMGL